MRRTGSLLRTSGNIIRRNPANSDFELLLAGELEIHHAVAIVDGDLQPVKRKENGR